MLVFEFEAREARMAARTSRREAEGPTLTEIGSVRRLTCPVGRSRNWWTRFTFNRVWVRGRGMWSVLKAESVEKWAWQCEQSVEVIE